MTADLEQVVHLRDREVTRALWKRFKDGFGKIRNGIFTAQRGKRRVSLGPRLGPKLNVGKINVFEFHKYSFDENEKSERAGTISGLDEFETFTVRSGPEQDKQ
jgi:hypothetical protein